MNKQDFIVNDELVESTVERNGSSLKVMVGEKEFNLQPMGANLFSVVLNGRKRVMAVAKNKDVYHIDIDSVLLDVREPSSDGFAGGAGDQAAVKDKIFAPMPGKVVKIMVAVGDKVEIKQPMVIVEAMKMENQVNSKAKGTVKAVNFKVGDQVNTETPIIELDVEEEA
ncbi:MAG: acetyl-CoA carboxylase biotin carboxyl carrier protein subunit [Candidatus Zixiibacteriota bacterium]